MREFPDATGNIVMQRTSEELPDAVGKANNKSTPSGKCPTPSGRCPTSPEMRGTPRAFADVLLLVVVAQKTKNWDVNVLLSQFDCIYLGNLGI